MGRQKRARIRRVNASGPGYVQIPRQPPRLLGAARGRRVVGRAAAHAHRARRYHVRTGGHGCVGRIDRGRAGPTRARSPAGRAVRGVGRAGCAARFRHVADVRPASGGARGRARAEHGRAGGGGAGSRHRDRAAAGRHLWQPEGPRVRRDPRGVGAGAVAAVAGQFAAARVRGRAHGVASDGRHDVARSGGGGRMAGRRERPGAPPGPARVRAGAAAGGHHRAPAVPGHGEHASRAVCGRGPGARRAARAHAVAQHPQAGAPAGDVHLRPRLRRPAERVLRGGDRHLVAGCAAAGGVFLALGALVSDLALAAIDPRLRGREEAGS